MITKEQALTAREFHQNGCTVEVGPRGGVKVTQYTARRGRETKTWKTRPDNFRVPIKVGFYSYGEITHISAYRWHTPDMCPLYLAEKHIEDLGLNFLDFQGAGYAYKMRLVEVHLQWCTSCKDGRE